ncbi:uncharacterized protein LOC129771558 isoform X2 [Toxorhynchites rutilus septentrionalis]|uniref:uncharacterized protein LOC129771558 isoform X2 n=1 Tax=Toxorhynchites rutilus septentrionalis TaxID=329112 RepID=UPI0024789DC4|nr:uncharacterized protein LOC129771558 isoform X2 [Toxorhynchites rutilus septentrionalis]
MRRCLIRLAAVVLLSAVVLVEENESAPMFDQESAHFRAQQKSCSNLCGYCPSCNGFYCGEECICECQQNSGDHAHCISKIRETSDKLGLVYDVLIQLPKNITTRFARSASLYDRMHPHQADTLRKVMDLIQLPIRMVKMSPALGMRNSRRH